MFYDDLNTEEQVSYLIKPILQVLQEAGGQLERSEIRDRREAAREGTPITLIDGNDLIRLVIKYELYITPVTTYVLDGFYTED